MTTATTTGAPRADSRQGSGAGVARRGRRRRRRGPLALLAALGLAALSATACGPVQPAASTAPTSTAPAGTAPGGTAPGTRPGTAPPTEGPAPTVPATTGAVSPPAAGSRRGWPVTTTSLVLVDTSRPTVTRGRTVAPERTLRTTIVMPEAPGTYPLVLFAHGYQLGPAEYRRILEVIAAAGYVVAAPSFPLADAEVAGPNLDRDDIPNQSGDLRFVADQLTAPAGAEGGPLALVRARVDGTRIGAVGHSDGADTVLDLGYHRDRLDRRVKAVVALSPDVVLPPGGPAAKPPLVLVHGTADRIAPFSGSDTMFARLPVPRWLVGLTGADHLGPVQGAAPWAAALDRATLAALDRFVADRTLGPGDDLDGVAADGVATVRSA